jgi:tripartite-type tricarboxylate transporter receptor subunit TctC
MAIHISAGRRQYLAAACASGAVSLLPQANAQTNWPNKSIRMIVGYTPGGFTDNMARIVAEPLGRAFGQQVVLDYKPGANSQIGVDFMAKSAPDGYTLSTVIAAHSANPSLYPKMPFDAQNDIACIALTGVAPLILVATASFPINNVAEMIAYVKARPNKFNYGSSGNGAAAHLAMEAFMSQYGLKMQHIPYKGTQPALTDLIGGQIQLLFDVPLALAPQIQAGKIKSLGVASEKRLPGYPDYSAFGEHGVSFIANTWAMVLAPAKTPKEIVTRLNSEINKILATPAVREKLESTGVVAGSGSSEDATAFLASEIARNAKVIKDAGIKLDA